MANPLLFKSSLIVGSYHVFLALWYAPIILEVILILGVLTSIYNHGTTSFHAKWLDRIAISLASIIDIFYILCLPYPVNTVVLSIFFATVSAFFIAKYQIRSGVNNGNAFHLSSHLLAVVIHTILFIYIFEYTEETHGLLFVKVNLIEKGIPQLL